MRKLLVLVFAALFAVSFAATQAAAQTQFATMSGRVIDSTNAVVPGAKVSATNVGTNQRYEAESNDEGLYIIANIPSGTYEVVVEKAGFRKLTQRVTLGIAERRDLDFTMQVGQVTEVVTVSESIQAINTTSGELSREITSKDLETLPLLTRDPYALVGLAAGAVDTGSISGDTRGLGVAIAGARTSSLNFMLDGGENNDTFVAGVGQTVPLDAVEEFKVQSNSTTAEFGRNAVNVNVRTKSGTNTFHGSAYEYYRGAGLSASTFDDNANGIPKSNFVRNQFGGSLGGPIIKDKFFFFGSLEGVRVRSSFSQRYFVPTAAFVANASADTNAFLNAFGGVPASNCSDQAITAQNLVVDIEGFPTYTGNELRNSVTGAIIPAATQLLCRTTLRRPADSGGGSPQNTWLATGRMDYQFGQATRLFGRYAYAQNKYLPGTVSFSPYAGFTTGQDNRNQNLNLTLTHSFSPTMFSENRVIYNRIFSLQPLGEAPATTACWQYDYFSQTSSFGGDIVVFPGYVPDVCAFAGIPFGGPQNIYQTYSGWTWSRGKHTVKWGGQFLHMRDNRTFGAYENAYFDTFDFQGMLDGRVDFIFAAIDPRGKVPGEVYSTAVDGPFQFPSFTRHYHYNELAFYVEDSWKVTPKLTFTGGLRWEYFGVHHSPGNERFLDANLYLDAVGGVPPIVTTSKSVYESVRDARFRRTNQFYRPDYNNFGPRLGLAYDIFGDGKTVFRAGYGVHFDRNFGNAVFNAIQNPPNYAVISLVTALPIRPNQFDTLGAGGASLTISSSARMLDNDLTTAYSAQWNATLEHDVMGKGIIASLSYIGANGYKLYSLNNLNQRGSCLLLPAFPCNPAGGNSSRLNQTGLTGMNRRGNEGLSRYHGMTFEVRAPRVANTGLSLSGNYAWAHSVDNSSSFFGDSSFEGFFGFGFRDAYNPALDRASSSNDIRHRGSIAGRWELPWYKDQQGAAGQIVGGWTISTIFAAQTGGAFTVYENSAGQCNNSGTNFCHPVLVGSVPGMTDTPVAGAPNTFTLYNISSTFQTQNQYCQLNTLSTPLGTFGGGTNVTACTAALINLYADRTSPRNLFRTPGIWNVDLAVLKDFRMPWESHKLQFRAEFFNVFNHSNLYAVAGTNVFSGPGSEVSAKRGLPNGGSPERRNIQIALRYTF